MASNKSKSKVQKKASDRQDKRRLQTLQIIFAVFSLILILSMILSLMAK